MKAFWKGIVKNLSNIFGLIGILLTLYFGVLYVPSWLREAQQEKFNNAQRNLQQSVKELMYSDSICTYSEIEVLIKAKELKLNQTYPLSAEEILTETQESFMQDRFLPLEKRKNLISKIESLKKEIPKTPVNQLEKAESKGSVWLLELLSILISLIGVVAGIISFYLKFKTEKEKDEEIESQIIESEYQKSNIEFAYDYEKQIINVIKNLSEAKILKTPSERDFGFDLEFEYKDQRIFIEAKYLTRSKVGLNSFMRFLANQKGLEGEFWFVYNTDLTEMVKRKADEMNKLTEPNRRIVLIRAENGIEFSNQINKILPTTMAKKS
jgi:hypothetical protein